MERIEFKKDKKGNNYLVINGVDWMVDGKKATTQLISHNHMAYGDVITTGLGLLIREKMLIENPNVTSITVIENCDELIQYYKLHKPDIMDKMNVILADANTYKGSCDTLLLDHYNHILTLDEVKNITKNIECKRVWWWGIELRLKNIQSYLKLKSEIPQLPNLKEDEVLGLYKLYN